MLLKSLSLDNFRQFIKAVVVFSTDKVRNVTIIRGDNGAGKTAFAQAFSWCLYGETSFVDKSMLNKNIAAKMVPGKEEIVHASLTLVHSGIEYTITREQTYKMTATGKLSAGDHKIYVAYKDNGQQEFVKPLECDLRIKQILPKELSRYFFFDGERIENMSKEIQRGRSQTFADAVQGLLGLSAYQDAIRHLKPTVQNSVIGLLNRDYDAHSDAKIAEYTLAIEKFQTELDKIETRLNEIENEKEIASERCETLKESIKLYADGDKLQKQKDTLIRKIVAIKASKSIALETMLRQFNSQGSSYFSRVMMRDAILQLKDADFTSKDIPEMHADTVRFLIQKGECICGNKLEVGNDAYKKIVKLFQYLPPESIGTSVARFVNETEQRVKVGADLFASVARECGTLRSCDIEVAGYEHEIDLIVNNLKGMESVGQFQRELHTLENAIRNWNSEIASHFERKGEIKTKQTRQETERSELTLRDANNRKIEIYKAYAQYMYDVILADYQRKEKTTREDLQSAINNIFKSIYNGGISLTIDDRYNIQVLVDNYQGEQAEVETSTAQSISVIFAFITGIIKLARESCEQQDAEQKLVASEPYPLVMDAPLSAFDKRRIKTVCDALPSIAEQVIIFIKDTDGEIADEHLSDKVGYRYNFIKENEFLTHIQ